MEEIHSQDKLNRFKRRLVHFNHTQELQKYSEKDLEYYPQEYRYFMKNSKAYDTLAYCNAIYFDYLSQVDNPEINGHIARIIRSLETKKKEEIRTIIVKKNIITPLLKRARATYQIDFNRSADNNVTQSLLHIYSSAYENTESLFILKWIVEGIQNKPLTTNFDRYKDKYGNILKGNLLNSIFKESKKFADFSKILNNAYNKKMRHLCFHNAAELNNENRQIIGIENPKIQVSYEEAFESFYALQQLHNYLRLFATTLLIEEKNITNEGVFNAATVYFQDENSQLLLLQLSPFYEHDSDNNKQIKEICVEEEGNFFNFFSDKEIIRIKKDSLISKWYQEKVDTTINIAPAYPDIYVEGTQFMILRTKEYGTFAVGPGYEVQLKFK